MLDSTSICTSYLDFLVTRGVISQEMSQQILDEQQQRRLQLGQVALQMGLLTMKEVALVLDEQVESGLLFGEQAIALGQITREQLTAILEQQEASKPSLNRLLNEMAHLSSSDREFYRSQFLAYLTPILT